MFVEMEKYVQQTVLTIALVEILNKTINGVKKICEGTSGCLEVARFLFQTYLGYS